MSERASDLTIGDLSHRSGVAEGTLRMWETRYAFPTPRRLPSGHRRYSEQDLGAVRAVLQGREHGLSLASAIERARRLGAEPRPSLYAALRAEHEHLMPHRLSKPALIRLTRAIEDECCARSPMPLLFACFQRERFYRQSEQRWTELARTASRAIVLADFPRLRKPRGRPAEVPIGAQDAVAREWVVVCDAPELSACLVGWERPPVPGGERCFETFWTVEPNVVRDAARIFRGLIAVRAPKLLEGLGDRLDEDPPRADSAALRAAVAVASRVVVSADRGE